MRRIGLASTILLCLAAVALADVVVCRNGRRFTGEVTVNNGTYTIRTKLGVAIVEEHDVDQWIRGDAAVPLPPATRPDAPATKPATRDLPATTVRTDPPKLAPPKIDPPRIDPPKTTNTSNTSPPRNTARPPTSWKPDPSKSRNSTRYAGAFPISENLLVTSAVVLDGATEVALQNADGFAAKASVVHTDAALGLAIVKITGQKIKYFGLDEKFAGGAVVCPAYVELALFDPQAELVKVQAPEPAAKWTVNFAKHPKLAGAPLLNDGRIVGVELATPEASMDRIPAVTLDQLKKFCADRAGSTPTTFADPRAAMYQLIANVKSK